MNKIKIKINLTWTFQPIGHIYGIQHGPYKSYHYEDHDSMQCMPKSFYVQVIQLGVAGDVNTSSPLKWGLHFY